MFPFDNFRSMEPFEKGYTIIMAVILSPVILPAYAIGYGIEGITQLIDKHKEHKEEKRILNGYASHKHCFFHRKKHQSATQDDRMSHMGDVLYGDLYGGDESHSEEEQNYMANG